MKVAKKCDFSAFSAPWIWEQFCGGMDMFDLHAMWGWVATTKCDSGSWVGHGSEDIGAAG